MLEPPTCDQRVGFAERGDDDIVGAALLALVVEHALALEARCFLGEAAIRPDRVGDYQITLKATCLLSLT